MEISFRFYPNFSGTFIGQIGLRENITNLQHDEKAIKNVSETIGKNHIKYVSDFPLIGKLRVLVLYNVRMKVNQQIVALFFGLTFFWTLFRKSWIEPLIVCFLPENGDPWTVYYLIVGVVLFTAAILLFLRKTLTHIRGPLRIAVLSSSVILALFGILGCIGILPRGSLIVVGCFGILYALTFVLLATLWSLQAALIGNRELFLVSFASLACSSCIMLLVGLCEPVNILLAGLSPLVCTAFLSSNPLTKAPRLTTAPRSAESNAAKFPWDLIIVLAVSNFAVALFYGIMPHPEAVFPNTLWLAMRLVVVVLSLFILVLLWRGASEQKRSVVHVWLALSIVLLVALFFAVVNATGSAEFSTGLLLACQASLNVFFFAYVVALCVPRGSSALIGAASLYAMLLSVSSLLANLLGPLSAQWMNLEEGVWPSKLIALITMAVVLVIIVYLSRHVLFEQQHQIPEKNNTDTSSPISSNGEFPHEQQPHEVGKADTLARFEERYNLSERESEVVALLVRGYSVKKISETLFISPSTVQTRMKNIYVKLGIHKKQELIDLIEHE